MFASLQLYYLTDSVFEHVTVLTQLIHCFYSRLILVCYAYEIIFFSGTVPGLSWENDEKTVFRMPWKHAGRQDYNLEEDSKIFMVSQY